MKSKLLFSVLLVLGICLILVSSALTPSIITIEDTESFNEAQNKTISELITIGNDGSVITDESIDASVFTSASSEISSNDLSVSFNPATITILTNSTNSTTADIFVLYDAYMGKYSSTVTIDADTFQLDVVLKSSDYEENLDLDIDDETYPDSIRVGSDIVIKQNNNFVENDGDDDADDVVVEAWLYDIEDKVIVSMDSFDIGDIKDDDEEEFDSDLELETDGLDYEHDYSLYIRAYSEAEPETFFVEEKIDDIDLKSEDDLCEVGDLEVELDDDDIDYHGDEISPGEEIVVPVTVENNGDSKVNEIIVKAWICEDDSDCTWDDDHIDDYKVSRLDAQDIDEDDSFTFDIKLEIDEDTDDGDYRLRVEAYEKSDDDQNCIGDDVVIKVERESEELIVEDVMMPDMVGCGESFEVEVKVTNIGEEDLDDTVVKVKENSGKLGISEISDAYDIDEDDSKRYTFNFKIPSTAEEGDYTFSIVALNDDEASAVKVLKVAGGCIVIPKVSISASLESDSIAGEEVVIKAVITNTGDKTATLTITTSGNEDWSTVSKIEPNLVTLDAGENTEVLIYLKTNEGSEGEKTFNIQTISDGQITEQAVSLSLQPKAGFSITGSSILDNFKGNLFIWVIVAINVILIVAIIIVASRLSK